ncbi:multicystatin-like [Glycine soja]|nr:multicystatin-like [Glycine soja]
MAALGGFTDITGAQNSIDIENLARFAVDEHNKKENAVLEFVRVISAKKQVVSGTLYYITLEANDGVTKKVYETKVLEKPWLNIKEVQEFKPITKREMATETKVQELGGITDVHGAANSVEINNLARFAVEEQNKRENSVLEFVRVISAQQQVVSGVNYYITLEAKDGEIKNEYEAKVWVREWLNSKELLEFKPVNVSSTPIGGITDVTANSLEIDILARFAVDQHNKKENANLEFVGVIRAKQQVVEGFIYYITLEAKDGETKNVYETKVWVRSWLNSKEVLEFKPISINPLSVSV